MSESSKRKHGDAEGKTHKKSRKSGEERSHKDKTKRKSSEHASSSKEKLDDRAHGKAIIDAPAKKDALKVGAVLVSTADFEPPSDLQFTLHHHLSTGPDAKTDGSATLEDSMILSAESESIDYVASNWDLNASIGHDDAVRRDAKGYSGEYLVGVYDPDRKVVTLRVAPMFTLRRSIKALNSLSINAASGMRDYEHRLLARRGLGEAFGNRKTKAKARADDRMKVDTSNMLDVIDTLQGDIDQTKGQSVSLEAAQSQSENARPIPPLNVHALTPYEAYPMSALIPDPVFRLLSTKRLEKAHSMEELGKCLPNQVNQSDWLKERMWNFVRSVQLRRSAKTDNDEGDNDHGTATSGILKSSHARDGRSKLKATFYFGLLWAFLALNARGSKRAMSKEDLLFKLRLQDLTGGEQILDDLFERFTETQRGVKRGVMTNFTESKLHAYMFAICLHIDDFSVDPAALSRELNMPTTKVSEMFRSLGCSTASSKAEGATQRKMVLKCPVELPKPRKGRAKA